MAQQDFSLLLSALQGDAPASTPKAPAATSAQGGDKVADFVGSYLPLAQRVSEKTGVAPEALLGQWGLETGWGKSVIPGTNNLGNIKDFSGKGPKAVDNMTKTTDAYRQYQTVDDFGDDFAGLLSRRYRTALNSGSDTQKYFNELKRLGYAEDPNYVASGVKASKMVANVLGTGAPAPSFSKARPLVTDRSAGEALADNLLGAASGVVTGVKLLADTFGADNRVSQALGDTTKALTDNQSQYRKDQRQERQYAIKGAEASGSAWNEIVANVGGFLEAPVETTLNALGTSAPTLLMAVIPGLGQAQAARFILQGAAGAAQGVGAAKSGIYDSVREELIKTGKYTADEAAKIAAGAQAYDSENAGNIAINGLLGWVAGTSGIESVAGRLAGRKVGQETSRGLAGRAGMGVVKESPVEGAQGGFERYTSNVALNNEGFDVDPLQGVFGQAAGEAIASAPAGAAFGALDRGTTPLPAPNPLQPVVDQASKPGSVLSRAVVSTGVADQPIVPPGGPAAGPGAAIDPISARVSAVETDLRSNATLEKIRGLTPDASSEFLYALNIAKNPGTRADMREQAITQVEQVLETAKSGTAFTMVPPEIAEPGTALTVPGQQGGDLATQQGGPLAPSGMGQFFDPNTVDVDAVRVDNMIGGPRAIEGPRARIGTDVSMEPQNIDTSEQRVAPVDTSVEANPTADSFAPEEQQTVADTTQTTPSPEIPKVSPGAGGTYAGDPSLPAATRKRAATLRQLADQGFETVERRGNEFFLKNSSTGQELKLDGMADSQLARNQIKQAIDAKANTAAASPLNDRAEPTAAQIAAGNYKKSDVIELNGMKIKIENPKDSIRRGTSPDGVQWETKMAHHYGEFQGTEGADGDKLDVFVGPRPDSSKVFVIDQVNEDGSFDEHKVMTGFTSEEAARAGYLANYEKGWTGLGAITEMPVGEFKSWAKSRAAKKPLGNLPATAKPAANPQPEVDQKARWIKAILDNSRLAGDTGIQLDVTPDGRLNFLGDPNSSKQGRSLLATLEEARKAGATNKEIADAIRASKAPKREAATPAGQFATLEEAKGYLSQQRRANGNVSGLPLQMADGSFGVAIKGTPQYAEAERQRDERDGANKNVKQQGEFFTVPDGGKQRKLKKVSKSAMPKKASPRRLGEPRALTQDEATLIEQVASVLGKTVVFFEAQGQRIGDGFFLPNQPGVLYVATETTVNPLAVFGHEFFHDLRETNPQAWNAIAAVVRTRVADPAGFRTDYTGELNADGSALTEEKGGELEELVSDLGGNLMVDPTFWRDVFAKINEDNGSDAKGIIARLAAALESLIARVMKAMGQPGFRADQFVTEIDAIRDAYKDGLANHIKAAGLNKASMGAEVAKASQQLKKSSDRPAQPGAITVEGYHFSQAPRAVLNTENFGTGLKGSARDQIMASADDRIKQRLSFYVDKGTGIKPESGIGAFAHKATLTNIYDGDADPLRLRTGNARAFESKVLDAGFSGYLTRMEGDQSGQVVLLGAQTVQPELLGSGPIKGAKAVPEATQRDEDIGDRLMANRALPAGQLKPDAWARVLMATMPEDAAQLMDIGALKGDQAIFKDELAALARKLGGQIRKSTDRAKSEYDAVVAQYKGTDAWMKAPDGAATKLSERQWVQVRTPAFKAWFGDWESAYAKGDLWSRDDVSKAVGANGEPLVVYHGTDKGGFTEFEKPSGRGRGDLGIWTTPDYGMARSYVRKGRARDVDLSAPTQSELEDAGYEFFGLTDDDTESPGQYYNEPNGDRNGPFETEQEAIADAAASLEGESGTQPGIYALFINTRNPNEENFEGAMWSGEVEDKVEVLDENGDQVYNSNSGRFFDQDEADALVAENPDYEIIPSGGIGMTTDDVVRDALRNDNDSAIIREVVDDGGGPGYFLDPQDIYVAFDPSQVKSADYNNGEFSDSTGDLRLSPGRKAIPESVDAVTSVESAFEFAGSRVFATNRDFKLELQRRAREAAKDAKVTLTEQDQRTEDYLVRVGEKDALAGLQLNANAVGWYNEKVSKAMAVVSLIHPELSTNPEARFAFIWALAVTSNGQKVNKNFELAEMVYSTYKKTGRMPVDIKAGATQKAINKSMGLYNELRSQWGVDKLMDFMVSQDAVKNIQNSSGVKVTGEGMNTLVYGAAILGPKIGNGFFMNLYGRFDQLTMDRWLMRTWGRWTGTLVENDKANIAKKREQLSGLIRLMNSDQRKAFQNIIGAKLSIGEIDKTADLIKKASAKPKLREKMNAIGELDDSMRSSLDSLLGEPKENAERESLGSEMRKVGNSLWGYLDGQKEAPGGSGERDFIRKVFGRVLARLKPTMPDLTMADLQAVVWYPEKRLYDAAKAEEDGDTGYADDEAPDYANAAVDLATQMGVPADKIAAALKEIDDQLSANKLATDAGRGDRESEQAGSGTDSEAATATAEGGLQDGSGIRRSTGRVDVSRGSNQGSARREQDGSLSGLPRDFNVAGKSIKASHWAPAEEVARQYMADAGLPYSPPAKYAKVDKDRAARIAAEYDLLEHNPKDPQVRAAYKALAQETIAQYQAVVDSGLEVEFIDFATQGDPYAASPRLMTEDVRENNHMWVFSTRDGFGSDVEFDPIDNPLLAETDFVISGKKALVNDLFRVVHDYFGHVKEGVGFRADGEENTWRSHSAMFTPLAQRALTTETRGQNSWVNYGPYGEQNRKADAGSTHYADQKVGLLPEWVSEEGRSDVPTYNQRIAALKDLITCLKK
jgi:hypothetical protein